MSTLTITEMMDVNSAVDAFQAAFSAEVLMAAESYDIEEDPETLMTTVTLYDESDNEIGAAVFEDYDVALVLLEEYFDIEMVDDDGEVMNDEESEADAQQAASNSRYGHAR